VPGSLFTQRPVHRDSGLLSLQPCGYFVSLACASRLIPAGLQPEFLFCELTPARAAMLAACARTTKDAFRFDPENPLVRASDGMGGQAHGEVASAIAVEIRSSSIAAMAKAILKSTLYGNSRADLSERSNRLMSAVRLANPKNLRERFTERGTGRDGRHDRCGLD